MDVMTAWFWLWLILAASLTIAEMCTATFFILPFAVGATAAMAANLLGLGLVGQWAAFIGLTLLALAACRPLANSLTRRGADARSGVDRLLGQDGVIINQPAPAGLSRAKVLGEVWNVVLEPGLESLTSQLQAGERVSVLRVDGTRLVVRRHI